MAMITASLLGRCGRRQLPRVLAAAAISSHKLQNAAAAAAAAFHTRIFPSYFASLNSATDVHFTLRRSISTSLPSLGLANYDDNSKNEERTILFEGCDYNHWLVTMHFPDPQPSREEKIDTFIKTLAQVVGSEEEAKKRIYALSTTTYTGFQAEISEELSEKLKGLPGVEWVLPDSYIDPVNKEYGGDKYINGVIIPDTRVYNNRPANKNKYRGSYSNSPGNQQGFNRSGDQQRINRSPVSYGDQQHINRTPPSYGDHHGPNRTPPSFGPPPAYGDQQNYNNPPPVREQQVYNRPPTSSVNQQEYHRASPPRANQAGYVSPTVTPRDQQGYYPGALNASSPIRHQQGYNGPPQDPSLLPQQGYNDQSNFQQPYSGPSNFEYQQGYNYQSMPGGGRNPSPNYQQGYNRPPEINGPVPGYPSQPVDQRGQYTGYQQNYYRPPPPPPPPMDSTGRAPAYQQNFNWPSQSGPVMADNRSPSSSYMDGRPPVMPGYNNPNVPPPTPVRLNESGQRTTDYNGAFRPAMTNEQCALRINDSYSSQANNAQDEHRGHSTSWPIEGEQ